MDFIKCWAFLSNYTGLQELALADYNGTTRVNRLDSSTDARLKFATENGFLKFGIGTLGCKGQNEFLRLGTHCLLYTGLNATLGNH